MSLVEFFGLAMLAFGFFGVLLGIVWIVTD